MQCVVPFKMDVQSSFVLQGGAARTPQKTRLLKIDKTAATLTQRMTFIILFVLPRMTFLRNKCNPCEFLGQTFLFQKGLDCSMRENVACGISFRGVRCPSFARLGSRQRGIEATYLPLNKLLRHIQTWSLV